MEFPNIMVGTVPALSIFNNEAATVEMIVAQLLFALRTPEKPGGLRRRAVDALLAMMAFCVLIAECGIIVLPQYLLRSTANFTLLFLASITAVKHVCRCDWRMATGIAMCGYALQHIAAAAVEIIDLGRMRLSWAAGLPQLASWTAGEATRVAVFAAVYAIFWQWYIRRFDVARIRMSSAGVLAALVASTLLVTVGLSSYVYASDLNDETQFAMRAISVLTCVIILLLFNELSRNQTLSDEIAFMRQMNDLRTNYYELLKDTIETTNVRYHDLKHQIGRLRSAVNADGAAGAARSNAVLDEISDSVGTYDSIAKTGNAALDVVLTQKSLECARLGIRFTYMADATCVDWISDYDIYSLFGNALDNAIEALRRLDDPQRRVVKLTMAIRGDLVSIRISNYFDHVIRSGNGDLITTKTDPASHGYGVKSIRMIVDALDGDMVITTEDGVFELGIVLPRPH